MTILNYNFNKHTKTQIGMARMFITWPVDTKIMTIDNMEECFQVARGTIQSVLKHLNEIGAIKIESCGSSGTFLREKNFRKLLDCADISFILGALPYPNYLLGKGLATGLLTVLSNNYDVDINLTYIRSDEQRVELLNRKRLDFAILSKTTANFFISQGYNLTIACEFGENSLFSGFEIIYANQKAKDKGFWKGMKVAVSILTKEQIWRSQDVFDEYDPVYVETTSDLLNKLLIDGVVDAVLRASDFVGSTIAGYPRVKVNGMEESSCAVLVINGDRKDLAYLIQKFIDVNDVKDIQRQVFEEISIPIY